MKDISFILLLLIACDIAMIIFFIRALFIFKNIFDWLFEIGSYRERQEAYSEGRDLLLEKCKYPMFLMFVSLIYLIERIFLCNT